MRNILFISIILYQSLFSFEDLDFDGVDDNVDMCLNTPFKYIVDKSGCPVDKEYYGVGNIEIKSIYINNNQSSRYNTIDLEYKYNNILVDFSSKLEYDSDRYFDIGYQINKKEYNFKNYLGIKYSSSNSDVSTTENDYYFLSSLDYYKLYNYCFSALGGYTKTTDIDDKVYKDYFIYSIGVSYIQSSYDIKLSYINSGSLYKIIAANESLDIVSNIYISKKYYIKLDYNPSILRDKYSMYIGFGVNFE